MSEEAERAFRKSLFILERRDHTEAELQQKLERYEFSDESIDVALERLKEYGLIDDRRFTEQYIRYHYEAYSKRALSVKLLKKGVRAELFDCVYNEVAQSLDTNPETEALRKAVAAALRKAERKGCTITDLSHDEKNRIIAALYRKGFSVSHINTELKKAVESY